MSAEPVPVLRHARGAVATAGAVGPVRTAGVVAAAATVALALALGFVLCGSSSGPVPAGRVSTVSLDAATDPSTTVPTTTAPTTTTPTTTTPPTTTTAPTTTSPTTTTSTTTTVPGSTGTSSFPWVWLVLALVIVTAAVAVIVMAVGRRNRDRADVAWRSHTVAALDGARLARGLLPTTGSAIPDAAHWQSVRERVEQAARTLERAGADAPTPEATAATRDGAEGLRGLVFALEADRLLRDGAQAPTPEQLAQADATTRARTADLDAALGRLEQLVHPPRAGGGTNRPGTPNTR